MTDFEKIIISLLGEHFKKEDFNKDYGFIDTFTVDRDKPTGCNEFFIAIDDRIRNKNSIDIARRYNNSPNLKKKYIKTINGIPYYVYSYWIGPILNKLFKDGIVLSPAQKEKIITFWGFKDDISQKILTSPILSLNIIHNMPLSDYIPPTYTNKGEQQYNYCPPFLLFFMVYYRPFCLQESEVHAEIFRHILRSKIFFKLIIFLTFTFRFLFRFICLFIVIAPC